jgi:hypothetical protein
VAERDGVAVEAAHHERPGATAGHGDHRLVEQPQPVDHPALPDQSTPLAVEAKEHDARIADPVAERLHPAGRLHRCRRIRRQVRLHAGDLQHQSVRGALGDPFQQATGTAEPAQRLRLVAPTHVIDPEQRRHPRSVGRPGVGHEGLARSGHEPQVVLDAPQPPRRIGVRHEVVGGESLGADGVEVRGGSGPVACSVGLPRLNQNVRRHVHRHPIDRQQTIERKDGQPARRQVPRGCAPCDAPSAATVGCADVVTGGCPRPEEKR